tara:strand:+ start:3463 stop:4395 length:933 start_codon:yes stop_codon:yes gene_type:complete
MKNVIVTGGCGFIGSHIVDELIDNNYSVTVIDNLSADCNEEFYFNDEASYLHIDIKDYEAIAPFFKDVDYVFHLAAESRIQPTLEKPQEACLTNFVGTCNVLEASRQHSVKRVMYSGTSSAYGRANRSLLSALIGSPSAALREDMHRDCLNPYSVSKTAAEDLCKMYYTLWNLETVIFRYFNVYGERQPTKGQYAPVVGLFLKQEKANEPLTLVGDGLQRRDFTHVKDVVKANTLAMKSENYGILGQTFNVGTGVNHSVLEIAQLIGDNFTNLPPRLGESRETLADITKISRELGYEPSVKLEDWIKENK